MRFALCLESSHQKGMGHLFRGMNLARALGSAGHAVTVIVNDNPPSIQLLRQAQLPYIVIQVGYVDDNFWECGVLEQIKPDCWINDRLDTSALHAQRIVDAGVRLVCIDDHSPGALLASENICALDLRGSLGSGKNYHSGAKYMILSPEIAAARGTAGQPGKIVITLGGSDTYGVTPRALSSLAMIDEALDICVVLGPNFQHDAELQLQQSRLKQHKVTVLQKVPSLVAVLATADIVLCAGGVTHFETTALGKPVVSVANEPHEIPVTQWFAEMGCSIYAGFHKDQIEESTAAGVRALLGSPERKEKMRQSALTLIDGQGLERVVGIITGRKG